MAEELITSAYLVALGNNRNNGRSLGLFTINANNALNNANANNWRPRLSFRTREALTCRKALHRNRPCKLRREFNEKRCRYIHSELCRVVQAILDATPSGLPIGFTGSHHFANLLVVPLYYLIRGVEKVTDCYVYMDNFIVYGRTKRSLHIAQGEAEAYLAELGMEMKPDWQIAPLAARPVATCGVKLQSGNMPKLYKKLNHRNFRNIDKFLADPTPNLARGLMSRYGWLMEVNREHILSDAVPLDYVKGKAK